MKFGHISPSNEDSQFSLRTLYYISNGMDSMALLIFTNEILSSYF